MYVLIDARHGVRQSDVSMLKLLTESRLTHQVCSYCAIATPPYLLLPYSHLIYMYIDQVGCMIYMCIVQVILTKSDVATAGELQKSLGSVFQAIRHKEHRLCLPIVHAVHVHPDGGKEGGSGCNGLTALKQSMCEVMLQPWAQGKSEVGFQGDLPPPSPPSVPDTLDSTHSSSNSSSSSSSSSSRDAGKGHRKQSPGAQSRGK